MLVCDKLENTLIFEGFGDSLDDLLDVGTIFSHSHGGRCRSESSIEDAGPVVKTESACATLVLEDDVDLTRGSVVAVFLSRNIIHN